MKKVFLLLMLIFFSAVGYQVTAMSKDSLSHIQLEEVVVSGTRAGVNTPVSYSNISMSDIRKDNAARNIPAILQNSPSLVSFTEDGLGVGNTYFRIRGTDATRINVTLNGMPLNNPETQEVFWVNLPDLSNSLQNIQIQRGVGTSTNGSAAFGASISLQTAGARSKPFGEVSTAVGSYGTFLSNIAAGTGVLNNGLSFDARYSRVLGNGYIRNGSVDHTSFYSVLSHYTDKQLIRLSYLKGIQHTGITWEGVSEEQMKDPEYGRKYNPAGEYYDEVGNRLYYDNETDNYYSDIIQLTLSRELNRFMTLSAGLSYNYGYGYYENYREDRKFSEFGLEDQSIDGVTYSRSDFVRQKMMENDFYVANIGLDYSLNRLKLTFGGMYSYYDGDHFGRLPWIKHWSGDESEIEWYRNIGRKSEFNFFTKADYQLNDKLSLFGDIQYRRVNYIFTGEDDDLLDLTGDFLYNFFNPKAGINIKLNNSSRLYASAAVGQREPLRNDLKDGIKGESVNPIKPERMIDYELGYQYTGTNGWQLGANFYYMDYHNQMVQTGKLNDVGYKLMENVEDSYRTGLELEAALPLWSNKLRLDANATFSRNRIKNYVAWFDHYDNQDNWNWEGQISEEYGTTNISFSPDVVSAASVTWQPSTALYLNLMGKYVSKQYMDNTSNDAKSIDAYFVSNISAGYTFKYTSIGTFNLQVYVNNLFNKEYVANGWAATDTFSDGSSINWIGYYPQAARNYMMRLTLSF
ncbi:MAG: TonB-dependent receptor [Fermentimonas sp.]|jgi:iron complex outermembrane receptor protein|nr:TonB-dependent receptor [Fermentimonas sp.]NLC85325.1 TonB-dependent receptor [Bacteroidales bacterium]MDD2930725.1 TonB-dependent receptor [Fermentimonas sp.]MDD3189229.1 TonB-dependent receptor [Fermentimonas sp.]MDD3511283.1 TonB-dependent receptor [Fermentimonas sp.]